MFGLPTLPRIMRGHAFVKIGVAAVLVYAGALNASAQQWTSVHKNSTNNGAQPQLAATIDVSAPPAWNTGAQELGPRIGMAILGGEGFTYSTFGASTFADSNDDSITLTAINLANGRIEWRSAPLDLGLSISFDSNAAPTVDPATGAIYAASGQTAYKFDARTHAEVWHTRIDSTNTSPTVSGYDIINSSPAVAGNKVLIQTYGGLSPANNQIIALDAADGHVVWFKNNKGGGVTTPCYVDDGITRRIFTDDAKGVICCDADTGAIIWNHTTLSTPWNVTFNIFASIVYSDGKIFVVTTSFGGAGEIMCADAATGARLWRTAGSPDSSITPLVLGANVYIQGGAFGSDARIAAYRISDGAQVFDRAIPDAISYSTDMAATASAIYLTDETNLYSIEPTSGTVTKTAAGSFPNTYDGPITISAQGTLYAHVTTGLVALGAAPGTEAAFSTRPFAGELSITSADGPAAQRFMSRNAQHTLLWGPTDNRLHLAYYEELAFEDVIPSGAERVFFRSYNSSGWGARERIDHAEASSIGGRHPSMTARPATLAGTGDFRFAWQDYRNATEASNYNDNIEIYGARRPFVGTVDTTNTRLTLTNSNNSGDNGYTPQIAALSDGRLALTWYDFAADPNVSEVLLKISNVSGNFGNPDLSNVQATTAGYRESGDAGVAFTAPSLTVDRFDTIHLVWATGTGRNDGKLYYGRVNPDTGQWLERERLLTQAGGYFDPAKVIVDPRTGEVFILYTDHAAGNDNLYLLRRGAGNAAFTSPIALTTGGNDHSYPNAQIDAAGQLHVVYVEITGTQQQVKELTYSGQSGVVASTRNVSAAVTPNSIYPALARPAIEHDPNGNLYVVWERQTGAFTGEIDFATTGGVSAARDWTSYE